MKITKKATIEINDREAEMICSWYNSEQEALLTGNVSKEWKETQTVDTVFDKINKNYYLVYQISKIPQYGMLEFDAKFIKKQLMKVYKH